MTISVALCTYNGEKYLREQLSSIFSQSHKVDQIVICDDISTEGTKSIIEEFDKLYPGVISLQINNEKLGAKRNFEKAISLCTGDYIFLSDQDDLWHVDKVKEFVLFFDANPGLLGAFSDGNLIDESNSNLNVTLWDSLGFEPQDRLSYNPQNLFEYLIIYQYLVTGAALCIKKEAVGLVTPFKRMESHWHDWWISIVLSSKQQLGFINKPLIDYRVHSNQQVGVVLNDDKKHEIMLMRRLKDNNFIFEEKGNYLGFLSRSMFEISSLSSLIEIQRDNLAGISDKFNLTKQFFLSSENFLKRQARLLYWFVTRQYNTRLSEVLSFNYKSN